MKTRAVIFDWAGTVVDYGCHAPPAVLTRIFATRGVELEAAERRHAMGLLKLDQIRAILGLPRVHAAWLAAAGAAPAERDAVALFEEFLPVQQECILEHSHVIAGVPELVEKLRSAGVRIGSTTGYTRAMMEQLLPQAAREGYAPDCLVTPDQVGGGRPAPWMIFENMKRLGVYPPEACVKVGDTASDMLEGRNAGMTSIGVCESSNEAVLHGAKGARALLTVAGAHAVIGTVAELWEALE